jgi:hypothetical protein
MEICTYDFFGVSLTTRYKNNEYVVYIIVNIDKAMPKDKIYILIYFTKESYLIYL